MGLADVSDAVAVKRAIEEFRKLGRADFLKKYGFGPARRYWLVEGGERFDSKAIVGAAHGFQHPERGPMPHDAFSGGEETVARRLRELGFQVEDAAPAGPEQRLGAAVPSEEPRFTPGQTYRRKELHERWGGQRQSSIVTPAGRPYIFLFTSGGEGNLYADGWDGEVYRYFGEGQAGNMTFDRGNAALRDHALHGKGRAGWRAAGAKSFGASRAPNRCTCATARPLPRSARFTRVSTRCVVRAGQREGTRLDVAT